MTASLDHRSLYRLPWSLPDNAISWLEPTAACNLYCKGCYRTNDPKGHKSLAEVGRDLDVFMRLRASDGISVAGGDPLMHPEVVEIVRMIAERGDRPAAGDEISAAKGRSMWAIIFVAGILSSQPEATPTRL
ncbi:MAG: radical SAM protein [Gemmatimonadetes bacterium]|nr:radical SAM protein [Gemmatimonadota bacterium]